MPSRRYAEIEMSLCGLEAAWCQARVSLWEVQSDEARLVCARRFRESDVEIALETWRTKWRRLQSGTVIHQSNAVYHPVPGPQGTVMGFVQAVSGDCGGTHDPEVEGYVAWQIRALGVALANPALEVAPERDNPGCQTDRVSARGVAPGPAVIVLASADAAETERSKTVAALERADWNASAAGRRLGITRQSVWKRMKRFGIPRPERSPFDPRVKKSGAR